MLETELKKLTASVEKLNEQMEHLGTLLVRYGSGDKTITPVKVTVTQPDGVSITEAPPAAETVPVEPHFSDDLPPADRKALGQRMRELSLKYGKDAQDAIKDIVLARSGTQAYTQVPDDKLPIIQHDIEQWVTDYETQVEQQR